MILFRCFLCLKLVLYWVCLELWWNWVLYFGRLPFMNCVGVQIDKKVQDYPCKIFLVKVFIRKLKPVDENSTQPLFIIYIYVFFFVCLILRLHEKEPPGYLLKVWQHPHYSFSPLTLGINSSRYYNLFNSWYDYMWATCFHIIIHCYKIVRLKSWPDTWTVNYY